MMVHRITVMLKAPVLPAKRSAAITRLVKRRRIKRMVRPLSFDNQPFEREIHPLQDI
jgi:hypothetical protein